MSTEITILVLSVIAFFVIAEVIMRYRKSKRDPAVGSPPKDEPKQKPQVDSVRRSPKANAGELARKNQELDDADEIAPRVRSSGIYVERPKYTDANIGVAHDGTPLRKSLQAEKEFGGSSLSWNPVPPESIKLDDKELSRIRYAILVGSDNFGPWFQTNIETPGYRQFIQKPQRTCWYIVAAYLDISEASLGRNLWWDGPLKVEGWAE